VCGGCSKLVLLSYYANIATMDSGLSVDLHRLTARMDRAADRFLSEAYGVSYRRFLTLLLVGEFGMPTQRALAEALGVSEPSVSRMTGVLVRPAISRRGRTRQVAIVDSSASLRSARNSSGSAASCWSAASPSS